MDLRKHLTAQSTQPETNDKLNRYTFLEKCSAQFDDQFKKSKFVHELEFPEDRNGLFAIKYNNDSTKLIAGYGNGLIEVIDADSGEVDYIVRPPPKEPIPIMCIRCVPGSDTHFFAATLNGFIYSCRFELGGITKFSEEKLNEINAIDIDGNAGLMISGGKDAAIRIYDVNVGKLKAKYFKAGRNDEDHSVTHFHSMRVFAVKFNPTDDHTFLSGGWDDTVKIWDVRIKNGCVKNIEGPRICGDALDIFDKRILTGSWTVNNSLQIWDITSGRLIENINPSNRVQTLDGEFIYCCQFFKHERHEYLLAGGSGTSQLEIISQKDQKIVHGYKTFKTIQAIDSNVQSFIAYGGMDNVIKVLYMI